MDYHEMQNHINVLMKMQETCIEQSVLNKYDDFIETQQITQEIFDEKEAELLQAQEKIEKLKRENKELKKKLKEKEEKKE